jgi:hypothetical protein
VTPVPEIDQLKREVGAGTAVEQLAAASDLANRLRARGDELLDQFVDAARATGASWSEIGSALGTSKQAAQQRFAALADPPPGRAPSGLSATAAATLTEAAAQARELGHHYVRPEHLVLGLLAQPQELAAQVLAELGVTPSLARERVQERLGTGTPRPAGSLGVAPQSKRLLDHARSIAKALGNSCPKTEHILLAATSPRLHSPAATLLAECGATSDRVRDQLVQILVPEAPELAQRLQNRSLSSRIRLRNL